MSAVVVDLPTKGKQIEKSVVDVAREILIRAKKGEFISIAISVIYCDGHTGTFSSDTKSATAQIGSVFETATALAMRKIAQSTTPPLPEEMEGGNSDEE